MTLSSVCILQAIREEYEEEEGGGLGASFLDNQCRWPPWCVAADFFVGKHDPLGKNPAF